MFFSQKEQTVSTLGRFVLLIWLFVVLIITSSYTASLTSLLTVQRLSSGISGLENLIASNQPIGYQFGSSTKDYLTDILSIPNSRLVPLVYSEQFARVLDLGPNAGGVAAIIDELPYIENFLSSYCNFKIVGHSFTRRGWGFAFQKDSPIVPDLSVAILSLAESGVLENIHEKWFARKGCSNDDDDDDGGNNSSQLTLKSFWGLFMLSGFVCLISLLIFFWKLYRQFKMFKMVEGLELEESEPSSTACRSPVHLQSFKHLMLFADRREEEVKKILKRSNVMHNQKQQEDNQNSHNSHVETDPEA